MQEVTAAAVDIGTNSVKLTIARRKADDTLDVLTDTTDVTRLGKAVDANGQINADAGAATLAALRKFAQTAQERGATRIAAVGTSALRDAGESGAAWVRQAQNILGGPVEIITGDREAHLIYTAARRDPTLAALAAQAPAIAVSDIGGGSTEIVIGMGEKIQFARSLQLGALRITERAGFSDPPTQEEMARARELARDALEEVPAPPAGILAVGSGGTIANLASLHLCEHGDNKSRIASDPTGVLHGQTLSREDIEHQIERLAAVSLAERRDLPGLEPARADVIIGGAIVQAAVLEKLGAETVTVSVRGLRYGLLYSLLWEQAPS